MDVLEILSDPTRHPNIEDEELYAFLNQFLVKHKSFNILNTAQEAAVCTAIKRRYQTSPPPPKTRDFVNKLDQQRTFEEDKKASLVDLFKRAGWTATASPDAVREMFRRKGVNNGNVPLTDGDVLAVIKLMCTTFSDFDARQDQSWNPENFGTVAAQLVRPSFVFSPFVIDYRCQIWIGTLCSLNWAGQISTSLISSGLTSCSAFTVPPDNSLFSA